MGARLPIHSIGSTLLLCLLLSFSHGLFTKTTCSGSECVQRKGTGAWCYVPVSGKTALLDCKGSQTDLQSVMNVHLAQDLSIAYYNGVDNSRFGGASWPVPANAGVVRLCVSGYAGDGTLQTLCVNVNADNSISGSPLCEIADGPHVVSDGCYTFKPTFTPVIQTTPIPSPPSSTSSPPSTTRSSTTSSSSSSTSSSSSSSLSSSSSSSSSSSRTSSQTSSSPSPSPTVTSSNSNSSSKLANNMKDIGVPIIVAVLGVVAAYVGAREWGARRARNQAAAAAAAAGGAQQQQAQQQPMQQPGNQQLLQQPNSPPQQTRRPFYGIGPFGRYSDDSL